MIFLYTPRWRHAWCRLADLRRAAFALPFGLAVAAVFPLILLYPASARAIPTAPDARIGRFDFSYASGGDGRAAPVQVFDNGVQTYFQFRHAEPLPAIFVHRDGTAQLLVPQAEGPYWTVPGLHGRFTLQLAQGRATVVHLRGERTDAPALGELPSASSMSMEPVPGRQLVAWQEAPRRIDDAWEHNSYATPLKGDRLQWLSPGSSEVEHTVRFLPGTRTLGAPARRILESWVRSLPAEATLTVVARDDAEAPADPDLAHARGQAMREALLKQGVSARRVSLREARGGIGRSDAALHSSITTAPIIAARPIHRGDNLKQDAASAGRTSETEARAQADYSFRRSDGSIQGSLRRWAMAARYQLVWDAPASLDPPLTGEGRIDANDLPQALERLLAGLADSGYALDATLYANRVLRITAAVAAATPAGRADAAGADADAPAAAPVQGPLRTLRQAEGAGRRTASLAPSTCAGLLSAALD